MLSSRLVIKKKITDNIGCVHVSRTAQTTGRHAAAHGFSQRGGGCSAIRLGVVTSFLGSGQETVAEHSHRTAVIGYVLAKKTGADAARTVMLCLFHDLPEARTGDFNYVNRLYDTSRERDALEDAVEGTGLEEDIISIWDEHACRTTPESLLAHDADQLDLILNLKRESDLGNRYADKWLESSRRAVAHGYRQRTGSDHPQNRSYGLVVSRPRSQLVGKEELTIPIFHCLS